MEDVLSKVLFNLLNCILYSMVIHDTRAKLNEGPC